MTYQFHYSIQGSPDRPILLFLHGFLGDGQDFAAVTAHLGSRFCCLAVDLPGHGQTVVTGGGELYTMPATAKALADWLVGLGIGRCALVGYSMGGRLALYLAIHYFQYFSAVVLESASPGLKTESERQQRSQRDAILAQDLEANFAAFLENWYQQPLFDSWRQHPQFQQVLHRRSHNRPKELANSLRHLGIGQQPSLWPQLPSVTQPLLLLVGARDRKFCAINQEMVQRCPTAQLETVSDCGHIPHLERPECFAQIVSRFLM